MAPYVPGSWAVVVAVAGAFVAALVAGFALVRYVPRPVAGLPSWTLFLFGTAGVERLVRHEPAGVRMLALIAIALVAMKAVVAVGERSRGVAPLSFGRWTGFAALWPGMQPRLFAAPGKGALRGAGDLIGRGIVRLAFGALLLGLGRLAWTSLHSRLVASICLLAGLSFVLHFGLCNLLAGV